MRIAHPPLSMPSVWLLNFMSQVGDDNISLCTFQGMLSLHLCFHEVISELYSVIMMTTVDFINTCYLFILL